MKKRSDNWDELREQIMGFGQDSVRKSYYPALRKRIAELEKTEAELRESRERLELALNGAELGMWDWNVQEGKVLFNERWAGMLGYTVEELEPSFSTWEKLVNPEDSEMALQSMNDHLEGRTESFSLQFRLRHKEGHGVWILSKGKVFDRAEDGTPLRACGTHLDISSQIKALEDRSRLESQVQHSQKLESLGVLAGGIAHDFNNLLVAILGNSDLALMEVPRSSPVWPFLDEVRTAAKRASELTNQMLAYSGKGRFVVESVNLNEVVREMGRLLEVTLPKKVELCYDLAEQLPLVEVDTTQIRQVVMNLVTNAADAMGENNGAITIATGVFEADRQYLSASYLDEKLPDGFYVSLDVSDTGCGMDSETQDRMFDPFYTTKADGRGLGMAAVQGIVRGHRGTVRFNSEVGQGTSFKVLLPLAEDQVQETESRTGAISTEIGPQTVLVVDDESGVRLLIQRMLEKMGHRVILACDGVEALEIFSAAPREVDLVLLDMTMPRMDGLEAFREMRSIEPEVRVILSSGYHEHDATNRFAGKGLSGFVQKPFTLEELSGVVAKALNGS